MHTCNGEASPFPILEGENGHGDVNISLKDDSAYLQL